jgi:hypothetical protein
MEIKLSEKSIFTFNLFFFFLFYYLNPDPSKV